MPEEPGGGRHPREEDMSVATWPWFLALAGLAAGFVMGFAARANHFCTMSALERYW